MTRRAALGAALCVALAACGAPEPPSGRKVLLLGLDGIRADRLAAAATPTLDSLAAAGVWRPALTQAPTVSGPGWSSMLTGVWAPKHGVLGNDFTANAYDRFPDLLTRIERLRPALATLAVVDWPPLASTADGGPLISPETDRVVLFDGDSLGYGAADSLVAREAAALLATTDVDVAFVYFGDVDVAGHDHGSFSDEYTAALATVDGHVQTVLQGLARRPTFADEDWLILVSTDHGRTEAGGHGGDSPEELGIFVLASGPSASGLGVPSTPAIVDLVPTALRHLGVPVDPAWQLDGRPLEFVPGGTPPQD